MPLIKLCVICGDSFETYPSRIADGRGKYCSRRCSDGITLIRHDRLIGVSTQWTKGTKPHNSIGWRLTVPTGNRKPYREIYLPDHPRSTKAGYVREHRLVMEQLLGRYLERNEVVHHKNGDTLDNRPDNLEVMDKKDHDRMNVGLNIHKRWKAR